MKPNKLTESLGVAEIPVAAKELECSWYGSELELKGWSGRIRRCVGPSRQSTERRQVD